MKHGSGREKLSSSQKRYLCNQLSFFPYDLSLPWVSVLSARIAMYFLCWALWALPWLNHVLFFFFPTQSQHFFFSIRHPPTRMGEGPVIQVNFRIPKEKVRKRGSWGKVYISTFYALNKAKNMRKLQNFCSLPEARTSNQKSKYQSLTVYNILKIIKLSISYT